jgi:hypothetical protein
MALQTDYLVKGCGASAMAFVDVMLKETDASFTMVDRRAAPGGHWNDAYSFVRLHQPSAFYGVASRALGHGRKDTSGFNQGLLELASGFEVTDYFHQVMRDTFLPSGRVSFHPMSEVLGTPGTGSYEIRSLLSGTRESVSVRKRLVDTTMLGTSIPLTHTRKFTVAEGVTCVPPNDLVRLAPERQAFTVLGGGKTAIDSVSWLLANGAPPDNITWVLPRDPWLLNRLVFQPGLEYFDQAIGATARQYETFATAGSVSELCERMEASGAAGSGRVANDVPRGDRDKPRADVPAWHWEHGSHGACATHRRPPDGAGARRNDGSPRDPVRRLYCACSAGLPAWRRGAPRVR